MSEGGDIAIDMAGGVATLRLRNPARRNAVSAAMWRAIRAFASEVSTRNDVRAVVIRGDGDKAFSAGADIADFESARSGAANARAYDDLVEDSCQLIEAIARPTIAVIIGPCMGAGASLAASCDLRIAADNAFFAVPAARLGLGYDPRGIKRFLRVFGASATCELIFTAERLPAQRAYQLGSVSALVPPTEIERVAAEWTGRIADNAPLTIAAAKAAIRAHLSGDRRASRRGRAALRGGRCQRRLCRGPPRLRGKTSAALHRQLIRIIRDRSQRRPTWTSSSTARPRWSRVAAKGSAKALPARWRRKASMLRSARAARSRSRRRRRRSRRRPSARSSRSPPISARTPTARNFVEQGHKALGRVDIMVNNAGSSPGGVIEHLSEADWEQSLQLKFMGYVRCLRYVLPIMVKQGGGRVVNLIGNDGVKPSYWRDRTGRRQCGRSEPDDVARRPIRQGQHQLLRGQSRTGADRTLGRPGGGDGARHEAAPRGGRQARPVLDPARAASPRSKRLPISSSCWPRR